MNNVQDALLQTVRRVHGETTARRTAKYYFRLQPGLADTSLGLCILAFLLVRSPDGMDTLVAPSSLTPNDTIHHCMFVSLRPTGAVVGPTGGLNRGPV